MSKTQIGLSAIGWISFLLENLAEQIISRRVAASGDTDTDHGVHLAGQISDALEHRTHPLDGCFDLNDGRKNLFVENVFSDQSAGTIGHQRSHRIIGFKLNAELGQSGGDALDVSEPSANPGTAEFDDKSRLAVFHAQNSDLLTHYGAKGLLAEVPGEGDIEAIYARIVSAARRA